MDLFSSATLWAISLTLLLFFSLFYLSFELLIFICKSSFLSFGCFFITSCSFFSEDTNYMYIYSFTLCGSPVLCCFIFWFILVSLLEAFPQVWRSYLRTTLWKAGWKLCLHRWDLSVEGAFLGLFMELGASLKDPTSQHLELSFPRRPIPFLAWGIILACGLRGGANGRAGFLSHTSLLGSEPQASGLG